MKNFQERLKILRKEKKQYQKDIAEILNITERQYNRYETGRTDLPMSKLIFLADFFDVSLDYLVGRCDNPNSHKYSNSI
ncbi:MAG: helix-turn-helix domain-containing protein [Oscillospiraceae bacterium]|jgi:transcriptional regulator with XRE-family HTH domain|nr:helix-turn-helix domain-containing protein [Oscillospiraceae bacterium]